MRLVAAALIAAACPALAQPTRLQPTRDVTVTYAITAPNSPPGMTMRMQFAAQGNRVRVDLPGGMGFGIMDQNAGTMVMVMEQMGMVMDVPLDEGMRRMILKPDAQYQRIGTRTIAGLPCTDWRIVTAASGTAPSTTGTACMTEDGVMLRAAGSQGGQEGMIEATQVAFAPIPPAAFAVPPNLRRMQLPPGAAEMLRQGGMPGASPGGMPGGPPMGMPPMPTMPTAPAAPSK